MIPRIHFDARPSRGLLTEVRRAARDIGCFYAGHPLLCSARCAQALADARAFFGQDLEVKRRLVIEGSPHFRGYSEMRNARDWREQIHFGREEPAANSGHDYDTLRGPNLWPAGAAWRRRMLRLLRDLEYVGRDILSALALSLDLPAEQFVDTREQSYLLLKLIHYPASEVPRSGVAAHVDFSWITLLLQDDTGGLEMRTPAQGWIDVAPIPGKLVVNLGEILQFATHGYFQATPHRVRSRSASKSRLSLPFFLNPGLETRIQPARLAPRFRDECRLGTDPCAPSPEHVHRVFSGQTPVAPFVFGEAEWRRKGLGVWCASCVPM